MSKHFLLMVALLLVANSSGCVEQVDNPPGEKVEVTGSTVLTTWYNTSNSSFNYEPGFFHDYPKDAMYLSYKIQATIKNIGDGDLGSVQITLNFCDLNDHVLIGKTKTIEDFKKEHTEEFLVVLHDFETKLFKKIDSVEFEIQTKIS